MTARVEPLGRIRGTVLVPPDKSISHRALIFNAIANGRARIDGLLDSSDVRATASCLRALGVEVEWEAGAGHATVNGQGLHSLFEADNAMDCANSGTTMRLLTGLLAAHPILSILTGDASLRSRPMARIISPLRQMGADLHCRSGDTLAPIVIRGGGLRAIDYRSPVASAQVKSAILLAGLYAEGATTVSEPAKSRDHTERMLAAMGVTLNVIDEAVTLTPPSRMQPLSLRVPGDISSAAPWLVLAACHPDAELHLSSVGTNPTRSGILEILTAMGADFEIGEERTVGGEPVADLVVRSSRLRGTTVSGETVPRAIDELPLVAVLACFAEGETVVRDAAELLVKESDRAAATVRVLTQMGARIQLRPDGFVVAGACELRGARVDAAGDHRIGMLAAVAGALASSGSTTVQDAAVEVSYPGFFADLEQAARGSATPV